MVQCGVLGLCGKIKCSGGPDADIMAFMLKEKRFSRCKTYDYYIAYSIYDEFHASDWRAAQL